MHRLNPQYIRKLLKDALPGADAHQKMVPPGRKLAVNNDEINSVRLSSVLLLLFPVNGEIHICLTKRNPSMKHHPGQISFPGGQIEEGENPELTALREAEEEVGVSPNDVEILGRLSELYIPVSHFTIFPYVGWINHLPDFILNPDEAEKVIYFPLQKFMMEREVRYTEMHTYTGILEVPYFPYEGEIIWGATAMILSEFLDLFENDTISVQKR